MKPKFIAMLLMVCLLCAVFETGTLHGNEKELVLSQTNENARQMILCEFGGSLAICDVHIGPNGFSEDFTATLKPVNGGLSHTFMRTTVLDNSSNYSAICYWSGSYIIMSIHSEVTAGEYVLTCSFTENAGRSEASIYSIAANVSVDAHGRMSINGYASEADKSSDKKVESSSGDSHINVEFPFYSDDAYQYYSTDETRLEGDDKIIYKGTTYYITRYYGDFILATPYFAAYVMYVAQQDEYEDAYGSIFTSDLELAVDGTKRIAPYAQDKYIITKYDDSCGIYSKEFKFLKDLSNYEAVHTYSGNLLEVMQKGKWKIVDENLKDWVYVNPEKKAYISGSLRKVSVKTSGIIPSNTTIFEPWYGETGDSAHFFNGQNEYNLVYKVGDYVYIDIFGTDMVLKRTIKVAAEMPLFGSAIGDSKGNIYILYGKYVVEDVKSENNMVIVKYDSNGNKRGSVFYEAREENVKSPFAFSTVDMAINGEVLAANIGRLMFKSDDGLNHQASKALYANIATMTKVNMPEPYTSHSFDQRVIVPSNGGFLFAERGDGYPRGFNITSISGHNEIFKATVGIRPNKNKNNSHVSLVPFHFREGESYNYTYSALGGIQETPTAYILAASSEKTLSHALAPNPRLSATDSDNIFIQVLKKNFSQHMALTTKPEPLFEGGETRNSGYANNKLGLNQTGPSYFLESNTTDTNVRWLTDYRGTENAFNPKLLYLGNGDSILMWEYWMDRVYVSTKYVILDDRGNVVKTESDIPGARLAENSQPLLANNKIYWFLSTGAEVCLYEFDPYA